MKRKSIITVAWLFVVLIIFSALQVCAQKEFDPSIVPDGTLFYEEGPYKFYVIDGKSVIYSADVSLSGDVTIPETLGGYPVKGICPVFVFKDAHYGDLDWLPNATSLTVPGGVEYIGYYIGSSSNIKKITLSYGLKTIAYGAFDGFQGTELIIPDSVTTIDACTFSNSNIKRIHIPASVNNIGENAFYGMDSLEEVTISSENKHFIIEDGVLFTKDKSRIIHYMMNKNDSTYVIPDSVENIDHAAFSNSKIKHLVISEKANFGEEPISSYYDGNLYKMNCLESVAVSPNNKYFSSDDGILYNKDKTWLLKYPSCKKNSIYKIPETVHSIKESAFSDTKYLKDIYIHTGIKSVLSIFGGSSNSWESIYYAGTEDEWKKISWIESRNVPYIPNNDGVHFGITDVKDPDKATTDFGSEVSDWAKEEIEDAYDKGLVPEILVGKDLTEKIDRAEFASIAVELYENMSGKKATAGNNPFVDVVGHPCESDIIKAYNLDVTTGTTATTFEPYANITREQMATMLTRAYKKSEFKDWTIKTDSNYPLNFMGVQKFADDSEISDYAKESVYFMARWEIINGVGDNKFAPKGNATVGESYGYATREQAIITAFRSAKVLK